MNIANYLKNFEQADFSAAQDFSSLQKFYESKIQNKYPHQTILEAGCGRGELTLWLTQQGYTAWGCDSVAAALPAVPFIHQDLLLPLKLEQKFDLVIDSHLFHCLVFDQERELYLNNIRSCLHPNGTMMIECLGKIHKSNTDYYLIQENGVIWAKTEKNLTGQIRVGRNSFVPFRRMSTVKELEVLMERTGFQILELIYENNLGFTFENFREEISFDLIRLILTPR